MRVRWRFQASSSPGRAGVAKTPCFYRVQRSAVFGAFYQDRLHGGAGFVVCQAAPFQHPVHNGRSVWSDVTDKNGCSRYRITHFAGFCCGYRSSMPAPHPVDSGPGSA